MPRLEHIYDYLTKNYDKEDFELNNDVLTYYINFVEYKELKIQLICEISLTPENNYRMEYYILYDNKKVCIKIVVKTDYDSIISYSKRLNFDYTKIINKSYDALLYNMYRNYDEEYLKMYKVERDMYIYNNKNVKFNEMDLYFIEQLA